VKILLDENLPESLASQLRQLGHQVDTINSLRLKGLDNGTLYRQVAQNYDMCFTKDTSFAHNVRQMREASATTLLRVSLPQQPAKLFAATFMEHFQQTDWAQIQTEVTGHNTKADHSIGKPQ
jgi:predicted nuclease of predicted toxin-antitoxin system